MPLAAFGHSHPRLPDEQFLASSAQARCTRLLLALVSCAHRSYKVCRPTRVRFPLLNQSLPPMSPPHLRHPLRVHESVGAPSPIHSDAHPAPGPNLAIVHSASINEPCFDWKLGSRLRPFRQRLCSSLLREFQPRRILPRQNPIARTSRRPSECPNLNRLLVLPTLHRHPDCYAP